MSNGYDLRRMTEAAVTIDHLPGAIKTEGPWLWAHDGDESTPLLLIVPASAVVSVTPCMGACRTADAGG